MIVGKEALICAPFEKVIFREGRTIYEFAAEEIGLPISVEDTGKIEGTDRAIFVRIPHPYGERVRELLEKVYELDDGRDKFYARFKEVRRGVRV